MKSASSGRTADLSRRHKVNCSSSNVISVTGGKLTTYREMAEDTVDGVCEVLGVRHKSTTKRLPLVGADGYTQHADPASAHLANRYGSAADEVVAVGLTDRHLTEPLVPGLPYTKAEAIYAARSEMSVTLDDVLSRRTRARLFDRPATVAAAEDVARLIADDMGWDEAEIERQVDGVPQLLRARAGSGRDHRGRPSRSQSVTEPTAPIELTGSGSHLPGPTHQPDDALIARLHEICETITSDTATAEASRDWWPLAMHWALAGSVPQRAGAVCRAQTTEQVAAVLSACAANGVPVTAAAGRSGVSGAAVPVFGGVVLDLTAMQGIVDIDAVSGVVEVWAGTFGPDLETELRQRCAMTVGHFPQSFDIATVGGWVACRGAGQYSTRYGKIEDMCVGLEVVLADGTVLQTGHGPAAAMGPDLTQLFLGSEGTLGVITRVWLRTHPVPTHERRAAYTFDDFETGIEACRLILRRGATPAVLRLYDAVESERGHGGDGTQCVLLVLDEGDIGLVEATLGVVEDECAAATPASGDLVENWLVHRNDTNALQALTRKGFVVDTMEIAAPWSTSCDDLRRGAPGVDGRTHTREPPVATSRTATSTARACTSPSPPLPRPTRSSPPTSRCGMQASARYSRPAATCRTITASGSIAPASWQSRWAPRWACCSR